MSTTKCVRGYLVCFTYYISYRRKLVNSLLQETQVSWYKTAQFLSLLPHGKKQPVSLGHVGLNVPFRAT